MAYPAPTANDIVFQALKQCGVFGVGQTPLAEDVNDAFRYLRQMIAQWQKRRWMVPSLMDIAKLGTNDPSTTIGPGGYWDLALKPEKIQSAYFRMNPSYSSDFNSDFNSDFVSFTSPPAANSVDYPLRQIFSYEDYSKIALKGLISFPYAFFYDNQMPLANLFVWPIPGPQYQIHLIIKSFFTIPDNVTDTLVFDPEYEEALWSNLAIRLCAAYQVPSSKELQVIAKVSLATIRNSNTQIPQLYMPYLNNNGWYNIYSDTGG